MITQIKISYAQVKAKFNNLFHLGIICRFSLVLIFWFGLFYTHPLIAQTTRLIGGGKLAGGSIFAIDADGSNPQRLVDLTSAMDPRFSKLIVVNNQFWGMTVNGGQSGNGTIFRINQDGTGYSTLHSFNGADGSHPQGSLLVSNGKILGMTFNGGQDDVGVIFSINLDGSGYSKIHDFELSIFNGRYPNGGLIESGGKYWGMTAFGGIGFGIIFSINVDGNNFIINHNFNDIEGNQPTGSLEIINNKFWGMTSTGGTNGRGTIFSMDTNGTNFNKHHDFNTINGEFPQGDLTEIDGKIWGLTDGGGINNLGVIFSIENDGTSYSKLHEFDNTNGGNPNGNLIMADGKVLGMTSFGGDSSTGVIFRINTDGSGYTTVHNFDNSNGGTPRGSLIESNNKLWGMALGGVNNDGVIFNTNTDGSGFSKVFDFGGEKGKHIDGSLVEYKGKLWGMTSLGGIHGKGLIFVMNPDGNDYTIVHEFNGADGDQPLGRLIENNSEFWATTRKGGVNNKGVIFKINTNGSDFTKVYDFDDANGFNPFGSFLKINGKLIGTTRFGGINNHGVIFSINEDGTNYTIIHEFDNANGSNPYDNLIISNNKLWGMTRYGGLNNYGVIFTLNIDGSGFVKVYDFDGIGGKEPYGSLYESNNKLWGLSNSGGLNDSGIIFSIDQNGTGFTKWHDFDITNGANPRSSFTEHEGKLWAMTMAGGANDLGVIFNIENDGSAFNKVFDLMPDIGGSPSFCSLLVLKDSQTISFSINDRVYGDLPITMSASSNTSNQITYSSSDTGIISISEDIATILGVGSVIITAHQEEDEFYLEGNTAYLITIEIAPLTASVNDQEITYGDQVPELVISYEGFVNGETATVITEPVISTLANESSIVGTYDIILAGGSADNYEINLVNGTITIDKAVLTARADDKESTYGEATPDLTISYIGFVNGESATEITEPVVSTLVNESSSVGTYDITLAGVDAVNYSLNLVNGELTVNKASLEITADDKMASMGDDIPELTMTFEGFVNSENENNIIVPVISTDASETSQAGMYDITLSGGEANNYTLTLANGTLLIEQVLGLLEDIDFNMKIYPNPVNGFFRVEESHTQIDEVLIYDLKGNLQLQFIGSRAEYNVKDLYSGFYLLILKSEDKLYRSKLLKE